MRSRRILGLAFCEVEQEVIGKPPTELFLCTLYVPVANWEIGG